MQGTGRKGGSTWEKPILDGLYVLSRVLAGSSCDGPGNLCLGTSTLRTKSGADRAAERRRAKPGWAQGSDAVAAGFTVRELKCATQPGPSVRSTGSRGLKVEGLGGPSFKGWTWNERGCCRAGGLQLLKRHHTAERCHRSTHLPGLLRPRLSSAQPWLAGRYLSLPLAAALGSPLQGSGVFYHLLSSRPQPLPGPTSASHQGVDILSPMLSLDSELTCCYHVHTALWYTGAHPTPSGSLSTISDGGLSGHPPSTRTPAAFWKNLCVSSTWCSVGEWQRAVCVW